MYVNSFHLPKNKQLKVPTEYRYAHTHKNKCKRMPNFYVYRGKHDKLTMCSVPLLWPLEPPGFKICFPVPIQVLCRFVEVMFHLYTLYNFTVEYELRVAMNSDVKLNAAHSTQIRITDKLT